MLFIYKILIVLDIFEDFCVNFYEGNGNFEDMIYWFKVVGELLVMFVNVVFCVIIDVVVSFYFGEVFNLYVLVMLEVIMKVVWDLC